MCGLFGWQWKVVPNLAVLGKLGTLLGQANDRRGGQSWGTWIPGRGRHRGLGELGDNIPPEVLASPILMAHSRWATHGSQTKQNSHPFKVGKIVGAHNGIIYNHRDLNEKYKRDFEVDSMHIFAHLDEGKDLSELEGYGTIEWVDKREGPGLVFLARMTESADLAVAQIHSKKDGGPLGVVWNSDDDRLKEALQLCRLPFQLMKVEMGVLHVVRDGQYWVRSDTKVAISARKTSPATTYGGSYGSNRFYGRGVGGDDPWGDTGNGHYRYVPNSLKDDEKTKVIELPHKPNEPEVAIDEPKNPMPGDSRKITEKLSAGSITRWEWYGFDREWHEERSLAMNAPVKLRDVSKPAEPPPPTTAEEQKEEELSEVSYEILAEQLLNDEWKRFEDPTVCGGKPWLAEPEMEMLTSGDFDLYEAYMTRTRKPDKAFVELVEWLEQCREAAQMLGVGSG
jgi:hypothetical protein